VTANEVLERARESDGHISVFDFVPLYAEPFCNYLVEGKTKLKDILQSARMLIIDIQLPLPDINSLLELTRE